MKNASQAARPAGSASIAAIHPYQLHTRRAKTREERGKKEGGTKIENVNVFLLTCTVGFFSFRYLPVPLTVPPVPTPAQSESSLLYRFLTKSLLPKHNQKVWGHVFYKR
jgi:hypothetical protein